MSSHLDMPLVLLPAVAAKLAEQDAKYWHSAHIAEWRYYAEEAKELLDLVLHTLAGTGPEYTQHHHGMTWSPDALRDLVTRIKLLEVP